MILNAALTYFKQGFSVIPIQPREKRPVIAWEAYQTTKGTEQELKKWWGKWPSANVGVVTGAISGLIVIDLDLGGHPKPAIKGHLKTGQR
jgi:putative DNA primase/helicase